MEIARPERDETIEYYHPYIDLVPEGDIRVLTSEKDIPPGLAITSVAFSPDGKNLFFTRSGDPERGTHELWRMPLGGGEPVRTGLEMPYLRELSLSPDGARILFTAGRGREELWAMENIFKAPAATGIERSRR